jgi:hypothetical protein
VLVLRVSLRQRVIEAHQQLHGDGLTIPPGVVLELAGNVALGFGWSVCLYILTWALTAGVFLVWLFRAVTFARSRGLRPNSTPVGAIVCWFIYFVSFVRPYNVVRSLYRVSRTVDVGRRDGVRRWPGIFPLWWWSWLGNLVIKELVWSRDATSARRIWMQVAGFLCATVAACCATAIIWAVQGAQDALAAAQGVMPEFVPPASVMAPEREDDNADDDAGEDSR